MREAYDESQVGQYNCCNKQLATLLVIALAALPLLPVKPD